MRKIVLALAAVAAFGLALPVVSAPAEAAKRVVVIKKHRDHGRHLGWQRGHHYGWAKQNRRHRGATVIVR
jgi:Ni/Co efflux regulator RcnB